MPRKNDELDDLELDILEELARQGAVSDSPDAATDLAYRINHRPGTVVNARIRRLEALDLVKVTNNGGRHMQGIAVTRAGCRAVELSPRLADKPPAPPTQRPNTSLGSPALPPHAKPQAQAKPAASQTGQTRARVATGGSIHAVDRQLLLALVQDSVDSNAGKATAVLARRSGVEAGPALSNRLRALDELGYIERFIDGRRTYRIAITDNGRARLQTEESTASFTTDNSADDQPPDPADNQPPPDDNDPPEPITAAAEQQPVARGPKLTEQDCAVLNALLEGPISDERNATGVLATRIGVERTNNFSNRMKWLDDRGYIEREVPSKFTTRIAITELGCQVLADQTGLDVQALRLATCELQLAQLSDELEMRREQIAQLKQELALLRRTEERYHQIASIVAQP
jgi:DNA-binding MarR family transcriptional regulator